MATALELRNEAREALGVAVKIRDAEGFGSPETKASFAKAWEVYVAKDKAATEAAEEDAKVKAAFEKNTPDVRDIRNAEDALFKTQTPDTAKTGVMVNKGEVIPFATRDCEGWIKGYPAAVQHPAIMKRYGPDLAQEAQVYRDAFAKWLRRGVNANLSDGERKALQEGTDSEGGFLVPADQTKLPFIHDPGVPGGTIRPLSSNFTTSRDAGNWPTVGSVVWAAVAEEAALPSTTDPVFGSVPFTIKKTMGHHKVAQELLEDSAVNLDALITQLYDESLGRYEDQQAIEGDGTTEPEGLRTNGVTDSSGAGLIDASDGWDAGNVTNMFFGLPAEFRAGAVWHTTSTTAGRIYAIGAAAAGIHFLPDPANVGPTLSLMGKPVYMFDGTGWDTTLSGTNEYGCFGDFRQGYYFINRIGMSIRRLNELYAGNDQVGFVARVRYDSVVAIAAAFEIMKGEA